MATSLAAQQTVNPAMPARIAAGLLVCFSLIASASAASLDGPREILILESGDQLPGRSRTVENGFLKWELGSGQELLVPLSQVDHIETAPAQPSPEVPPAPAAEVPPVPPVAGSETAVTTPEATAPPQDPPWTDNVPFYSTLHEGWVTVRHGYTVVNDTASTWTRRFTFGGQFNDGNSQIDTVNLQFDFEHSPPKQLRQLEITGLMARNQGIRTTNRWIANSNHDWPLDDNDKWIMFFTSKNEYDELAHLDYRGTLSTGMGYRFYNEAKKRLITRFGPGYTIEIFNDPPTNRQTPDIFGEVELRWPVSKRSSYEQKVRVNPSLLDFELVRTVSTSSLLVDLDDKDRWKLRVGFNFTYNSQPSAGRLPADYLSTLSLMYTRK